MNRIALTTIIPLLLLGCTADVIDNEQFDDEEDIGSVETAFKLENAIHTNAIHTNAIHTNALSPATLPASEMTAMQEDGETGELTRMLVKYLVSCAFTETQAFTFSWTDSEEQEHYEIYMGEVGLAPEWANGPLDLSGQKWVTACILARVNYYGVSVHISMRGSHPALACDPLELNEYPQPEGAFWGNMFVDPLDLKTCYVSANREHSRTKQRDCAAGHVNPDMSLDYCAPLESEGDCAVACSNMNTSLENGIPTCDYGYRLCEGHSEVVTVLLPN